MIEIMTHRYREHCGPNYDDNLNYRKNDFLERWNKRDILKILIKDLINSGLSHEEITKINKKILDNINNVYLKSKNIAINKHKL